MLTSWNFQVKFLGIEKEKDEFSIPNVLLRFLLPIVRLDLNKKEMDSSIFLDIYLQREEKKKTERKREREKYLK